MSRYRPNWYKLYKCGFCGRNEVEPNRDKVEWICIYCGSIQKHNGDK